MDRWIPLAEAVALIGEALGDSDRAQSELVRALEWGELTARARIYREVEPGRVPSREHMGDVPAAFWRLASVSWADSAAEIGDEYFDDDGHGNVYLTHGGTQAEATDIRLRVSDLDRWLSAERQQTKPRGIGRPRGRSMGPVDAPLVARMRAMVDAGEVPSPTAAARKVVNEAQGGGTEESRIARLVRSYKSGA